MPTRSQSGILRRLSGEDAEAAWADFLEAYSPLLFQVARRFDRDEDRLADCYLYVCSELHRNDFRRLQRYRPDGPARFSTWLTTVVRNLCLDWRRQALGAPRPFRAVSRRSPLAQDIFRCVYHQGMTLDEVHGALQSAYPDLDRARIGEVLTDLHEEMSSRQFWLLGSRRPRVESLSARPGDSRRSLEEQVAGTEPDPEAMAESSERRAGLWEALSRLSSQERLLLRLRYELDLPLREVARLGGLADPQTAHRRIAKALRRLEDSLGTDGG